MTTGFGRRRLFEEPLQRGLDPDGPRRIEVVGRILERKPFLQNIYREWYQFLVKQMPPGPGWVLELGSGGGFFHLFFPEVITSDVLPGPKIDLVTDARRLSLPSDSLRGLVMINVLHHIPDVEAFLHEASRCVRVGGVLAMVEPWLTPWSRPILCKLHDEPCLSTGLTWGFPDCGPMSGANQAIPWIVFRRDFDRFKKLFPQWELIYLEPFMPIMYLFSGGISRRCLFPFWSYGFLRTLDKALVSISRSRMAMFARISLRRVI